MSKAQIYALVMNEAEPFKSMGLARFRKELIRTGQWRHPAGDFTLEVTPERMRAWLERFQEMKRDGMRVPVPYGHSYDSRDNAGFLEDLEVEDDRLFGILNIPKEEDWRKIGSTIKDVSVSINPDFVGGSGKSYSEVIEHVALTNYPVVAGQSDFQMVAAHEGGEDVEVLTLEMTSAHTPDKAEHDEAPVEEIKKVLGFGAEVSASNLAEHIRAKLDTLTLTIAEFADKADEHRTQHDFTLKELGRLEDAVAHAEQDRLQLELREADEYLGRALEQGRLSPAMRATAKRLLLPGSYALGRNEAPAEAEADARQLFMRFVEMIPEGTFFELKRKTRHFPMPSAADGSMTDQRASELAQENRSLVRQT